MSLNFFFKETYGSEKLQNCWGYAQRHHLADHAGAVRFEHAWACIEVTSDGLLTIDRLIIA